MNFETPLFRPFETDALDWPDRSANALVIGADQRFRLPNEFAAAVRIVQGFRGDYLRLKHNGFKVSTIAPIDGAFDLVLILASRHRRQNEIWLADAIDHVKPGGSIVMAGGKTDGVASLRKRLSRELAIGGHQAKQHGEVFWFLRDDQAEAWSRQVREHGSPVIEGRFHTAPGMFSHDRVDAGSKLLADNLPSDLAGHVADFCAGWGYLASEVAGRFPKVKALDLYEADFASLEAAKQNLADVQSPPVRFFWHDLVGEPVRDRYDAIVMNPPFHTGRQAEPSLGQTIIKAAAGALKPGGRLLLVANRQLPYERTLSENFSGFAELANDGRFKVFAAKR